MRHLFSSTKKRKEYAPLVIPLKKPKLKPQKAGATQPSSETDAKVHDSAVDEKNLDSVAAEEILQGINSHVFLYYAKPC